MFGFFTVMSPETNTQSFVPQAAERRRDRKAQKGGRGTRRTARAITRSMLNIHSSAKADQKVGFFCSASCDKRKPIFSFQVVLFSSAPQQIPKADLQGKLKSTFRRSYPMQAQGQTFVSFVDPQTRVQEVQIMSSMMY